MNHYNSNMVSIITPCHNSETYIRDTIESVLQQTYKNIEYIIIDDGSNDGSWQIIKSYGNKIKSYKTKNLGACHARNFGYKKSKGNYLLFLDSDDIISRDMIQELLEVSYQYPDSIIASPWTRIKKSGLNWLEENKSIQKLPPNDDPVLGWLSGWYYPPCSILWPTEIYLEKAAEWDESLHANQDGDLMLRALLNGANFKISDKGKSFYRLHDDSTMSISKDIISANALISRMKVLNKVITKLIDNHQLDDYKDVIGIAYHKLARNNILINSSLSNECIILSKQYGNGNISGTFTHKLITYLVGLRNKEKIAQFLYNLGFGNIKRNLYNIIKDNR